MSEPSWTVAKVGSHEWLRIDFPNPRMKPIVRRLPTPHRDDTRPREAVIAEIAAEMIAGHNNTQARLAAQRNVIDMQLARQAHRSGALAKNYADRSDMGF